MKTIKSICVTEIKNGGLIRWCTRVRFTDDTELFAGVDNQHGKAVAEEAHKNTYAVGLKEGQAIEEMPTMNHPISREVIQLWKPLPANWTNGDITK